MINVEKTPVRSGTRNSCRYLLGMHCTLFIAGYSALVFVTALAITVMRLILTTGALPGALRKSSVARAICTVPNVNSVREHIVI